MEPARGPDARSIVEPHPDIGRVEPPRRDRAMPRRFRVPGDYLSTLLHAALFDFASTPAAFSAMGRAAMLVAARRRLAG
jgi:hypothetical protein